MLIFVGKISDALCCKETSVAIYLLWLWPLWGNVSSPISYTLWLCSSLFIFCFVYIEPSNETWSLLVWCAVQRAETACSKRNVWNEFPLGASEVCSFSHASILSETSPLSKSTQWFFVPEEIGSFLDFNFSEQRFFFFFAPFFVLQMKPKQLSCISYNTL